MGSLRGRAIIGGSIWAAMIVVVGGFALISYFGNSTQKRFDNALEERHLQLVVALNNTGGDPDLTPTYLTQPAYERPFSGSFWQAAGPDNIYLTSRSLFDEFLIEPEGIGPEPQFWQGPSPVGPVRGIHQLVELSDGSEWIVMVAESLEALEAEQLAIQQSLFSTLGLIGALGMAAAVLLTSIVVRPLSKLREDVSHRWDSGHALNPEDYPDEVAPLVQDINTLLARNREIVDRARRQGADMAHALKTPSAILRNELEILGLEGADITQAQEALARIDSQLFRSLARIRAANTGAGVADRIDVSKSIDRMARVFRSMHQEKGSVLDVVAPEGLKVSMDIQDLEEVLGNMLENAFKYGNGRVRLEAREDGKFVVLTIDDDGPGISEDDIPEALRSGGRLDSGKPGTGLGLAIANDLLHAYGGGLDLERAPDLGGLRVVCRIPTTPVVPGLSAALPAA